MENNKVICWFLVGEEHMERIKEAVNKARKIGLKVSQAHFRYLNPMPKNTGEVLKNFKKVLIPEINLGQLATFNKK